VIRILQRALTTLAFGSLRAPRRLLCAAVLVLAAVGCRPATGSDLARILAAGELRVGTSADLPPLNLRDREGRVAGLEADLVRALGQAMQLEVRFVEKPFAELLPALERREVDLVVAGLTITPERNARVAFAGPYFISGTSLVSRSQALTEHDDPSALDGAERRYAALESSTSVRFVRTHMPKAALVPVPNYEVGMQKLLAGEVDALVADFNACRLAQWRNPDAGLHVRMTPYTTEPLGIALPPDAPLLLNLVANYLNTLESTGELAQLKARWLSDGSGLAQLP
jgi:polar amino acid transport system substrate-binding protein